HRNSALAIQPAPEGSRWRVEYGTPRGEEGVEVPLSACAGAGIRQTTDPFFSTANDQPEDSSRATTR
ncbi:MAG: hypothetical protein EBU15_14025, partial [Betaproteobacteria bacterium]|nr:hypothetical protein [Betaproteobacteria bacterium]